jgi:hypothetical protein
MCGCDADAKSATRAGMLIEIDHLRHGEVQVNCAAAARRIRCSMAEDRRIGRPGAGSRSP